MSHDPKLVLMATSHYIPPLINELSGVDHETGEKKWEKMAFRMIRTHIPATSPAMKILKDVIKSKLPPVTASPCGIS